MVDVNIKVRVNGIEREATVDSRLLLVELLREEFGLTGTHVGCRTGNCGACTVIMDGLTVKSCTVLAAQANGADITTIEGLTEGLNLTPLQQAFNKHYALQCGFCTPGIILSAHHLLSRNPKPTEQEIRHAISGNLCRCTGYVNIVKAVAEVAGTLSKK
ncbi:MAG: (2Fe-2S)-binding protein [Candidatus Bathyarchaeia archaeon]